MVTANRRLHPIDLEACLSAARRGARTTRRLLMQEDRPDDLTAVLLDAVGLFDELGVPYALVGGLAAMIYGRGRFTEDVDLIAAADYEQTLQRHPDAMRKHRFDPSCTWKLYHDSGLTVDLWKDEHVPAMLGRARATPLAGREVRVVDVLDLLAMKLRADRPQDDYDISQIIQHASFDEAELQTRLTPDLFERYHAIKKRSRS